LFRAPWLSERQARNDEPDECPNGSRTETLHPVVSPADLTDPVTARKKLAALAAAAPTPHTMGMQIEDRTVPADPNVSVRFHTGLPTCVPVERIQPERERCVATNDGVHRLDSLDQNCGVSWF
jgi:hypothetical protein